MSYLDTLPRPFFVLAPMDDVTDTVFRQVVQRCSPPDLYFTEFVNVDGLQSPGRNRLLKKVLFNEVEKPIVAQIWGLKPENFYKTVKELIDMGYSGIDLNMGCPEKTVVKNGACSGLINNPDLAKEIIAATKAAADNRVPVSVKTRIGFNEINMDWLTMLLDQELDMLTIHGRTRKEMSKVPAHWDVIGNIRELRDKKLSKTLIVGNGDIRNRKHGMELAKEYQLDGVMIGRGIFSNPYAFSADPQVWDSYSRADRIQLYISHVQKFADTWKHNERPIHTLNKFCKIYINGFDGAKELRETLMSAQSSDELLKTLDNALSH